MCGIIGYVGKKAASPILLEGLRRLEYRGYDSAGVAIFANRTCWCANAKGKIDEGLAKLLETSAVAGQIGIGHTRWATHGPPSDENSHPHLDQSGKIAVVHNGVIENYDRIKQRLIKAGHQFHSSTDTEVLAHLIGEHYEKHRGKNGDSNPLALAVCDALREVIGTYGIAVVSADHPGMIVGARRGSPLIIGIGDGENFLASDANAIVAHTRQVVYLNDYDVATITADRFDVQNLGTDTANVQISKLEFNSQDAERGEFPHFMLKEIFEQPRTVENALRGRVDHEGATAKFGGLNMTAAELRGIDRIVIAACGTSWHAALVGEYLIEELAHISGRSRIRQRISLSQRAAGKQHRAARPSRNPAKRPTRWPRCAKPNAAGTKRWPFSTSSAAPSRAKPTAAFTCTPGRKSAWRPPRRLSPRSPCCRCSRCIWAGCECCPPVARWKL